MVVMSGTSSALSAQTLSADSDASHPVVAAFSYTGELVSDVAGGARKGTAYVGAAAAQVTVLLHRLVGWRGAQIFVFGLDTHGGAPSDLVGDVQGVSNLQAPASTRLEELWLQQNLLGNRVSWLVGRYDVSTEFYRVESGALFVNSSFGIGPEFGESGVAGPSIFPHTAAGTRVALKPSPNVVWRAAVLDGVPVDRPGGGIHLFAPGDGLLFVSEVALLSRPDTGNSPHNRRFRIGRGAVQPYAGKLALGGWYYTARFPDLSDTLSTGAPVQHRGSYGAYVVGDQTVWSAGGGHAGALTAFAQLGLGDSRVNQVGRYLGAGLTLTAPFAGRPQDEVGLAVAAAVNGSHFLRTHGAPDRLATAETTPELTYLAQFGSWFALQPDVQYVIHPGKAPATRNALVLGLRIAVSP
jgi:porin